MNPSLNEIINYIVGKSTELKNKFTNAEDAPVEFACIFCQSEEEYKKLTKAIQKLGKVVQDTQSGYVYLLDEPIQTKAGPLKLVKIRKLDPIRKERGDADFNTDYQKFKELYKGNPKFKLIKRENFEMLRLSGPQFDVMACFSSVPLSKNLGINLFPF